MQDFKNAGIIISPDNKRIKRLISLRKPDCRRREGLILIEGLRECRAALNAQMRLEELYLCLDFINSPDLNNLKARIKNKSLKVLELSKRAYQKVAFGSRQEGIIAIARCPQFNLKDLRLSHPAFVIVLDAIEKPGNLGAVIRTIEAAGFNALIVTDSKVDLYNPNVIRSSLGAIFNIQTARAQSKEAVDFLKGREIKIFSAVTSSGSAYTDMDYSCPCAIAFGGEENGLGELWKESSDCQITIPMSGNTDSLNVSVSCGIMIYEALRQRKQASLIHSAALKPRPAPYGAGRGKNAPLSVSILSEPRSLDRGVEGLI